MKNKTSKIAENIANKAIQDMNKSLEQSIQEAALIIDRQEPTKETLAMLRDKSRKKLNCKLKFKYKLGENDV